MKLNPLTELPSKYSRNNHGLKTIILEFYNSKDEYAEIEFDNGEYSSSYSLYDGLRKAITTLDIPVKARMIQGGVYLERI